MYRAPTLLKVLVADDAELLRQRMVSLLSKLDGIGLILESQDCSTTLEAIEQHEPDVVLLDLRMPDGSGLRVLRALRGRERRPRVMILTTWGDPDVRRRCLDAGADEFFEKGTEFMGAIAAVEAMTK